MGRTAFPEGVQHDLGLPGIDAAQWLKRFDSYLLQVRGLAPRTREGYCFWVSRFLKTFTAQRDLSSLRGQDVTAYVQREASRLKRNARGVPGTAIRALLRYLTFAGVTRHGLEAAVPRMPKWKYADLPRYLPPEDIDRVVAGVLDDTATGRRNHAILLLLARTGMRADEIVKLTLDDIDWREGTIRIRSGKSRRERHLPLSQEVGSDPPRMTQANADEGLRNHQCVPRKSVLKDRSQRGEQRSVVPLSVPGEPDFPFDDNTAIVIVKSRKSGPIPSSMRRQVWSPKEKPPSFVRVAPKICSLG